MNEEASVIPGTGRDGTDRLAAAPPPGASVLHDRI
jgi:hypothetical protein